jgi:4-hydroxybenzoate polyprenyltransferase
MNLFLERIYRYQLHIGIAAVLLSIEHSIVCTGQIIESRLLISGVCATLGYIYLRQYETNSTALRIVLTILILGIGFLTTTREFLALVIGGILVLFYAHSFRKWSGIRAISIGKTATIGICWALMVCGIPETRDKELYHAVSVFFLVTAISMQCDIRDMEDDRGIIQTIPLILEVRVSRLLILLMLALSCACLWPWLTTQSFPVFIAEYALMLLTMLISSLSGRMRNKAGYELLSDLPLMLRGLITMGALFI